LRAIAASISVRANSFRPEARIWLSTHAIAARTGPDASNWRNARALWFPKRQQRDQEGNDSLRFVAIGAFPLDRIRTTLLVARKDPVYLSGEIVWVRQETGSQALRLRAAADLEERVFQRTPIRLVLPYLV
jgi:hypothetical protein